VQPSVITHSLTTGFRHDERVLLTQSSAFLAFWSRAICLGRGGSALDLFCFFSELLCVAALRSSCGVLTNVAGSRLAVSAVYIRKNRHAGYMKCA
jgi:hypothetical protein